MLDTWSRSSDDNARTGEIVGVTGFVVGGSRAGRRRVSARYHLLQVELRTKKASRQPRCHWGRGLGSSAARQTFDDRTPCRLLAQPHELTSLTSSASCLIVFRRLHEQRMPARTHSRTASKCRCRCNRRPHSNRNPTVGSICPALQFCIDKELPSQPQPLYPLNALTTPPSTRIRMRSQLTNTFVPLQDGSDGNAESSPPRAPTCTYDNAYSMKELGAELPPQRNNIR